MTGRSETKAAQQLLPAELIEQRIFLIRGQRVMIDSDLAELYDIETFNLNKAVKRNLERFPSDFMFQLTGAEFRLLTFQTGMSKAPSRGGRRTPPFAFTEQGVAMLSSVLNGRRAVRVNILIMRVFIRPREMLAANRDDIDQKLNDLEKRYTEHDVEIKQILTCICRLMQPKNPPPSRQIGFVTSKKSNDE
jgi:hypothetical protein